jgi:hypothetical protein
LLTEAALPDEIRACLQGPDPASHLVDLAGQPFEFDIVTGYQAAPPFILGLAAMVMSQAFLKKGQPAEVPFLLERFSDAVAPPERRGDGNWRMLGPFPFHLAPLVDAALARDDHVEALTLLNRSGGALDLPHKPFEDTGLADLLPALEAAGFGPFHIDWDWLLARQEQLVAVADLDHRLETVQVFHAHMVEAALRIEQPERVLPLIGRELDWYLGASVIDVSHFEFNAICVLAAIGRHEEALAAARKLVRRGYHLHWRFNLGSAAEMKWTQEMRQNEWLAELAATPEYAEFLAQDLPARMLGDEPEVNPLCLVRDGVWTGKKDKRCAISRQMIKPGDAVVRFRRLFNRSPDGGLEIARKDLFEASPWQINRQQFEDHSIPLAALFPRNVTRDASLDDTPFLHAFCFDLARNPDGFDIGQAVALVADHEPPPISLSWKKPGDADRWVPDFPSFAGADGHGDAVNFVWRLIRAGYRQAIISLAGSLAQDKADKVFALLATFADPVLRQAAADHFAIPSLPAAMEMAFKDRLAFEDHLTLAAFGASHPRFRLALVASMRAYALHLYSNYQPGPDWFLAGLEHFGFAGGSALLYFLIDHPEDDYVLQTVIERRWLPAKSGNADHYRNARPFYVRAALFHLMRHRPQELPYWLEPSFVAWWKSMAYDRETLRLSKQIMKQVR